MQKELEELHYEFFLNTRIILGRYPEEMIMRMSSFQIYFSLHFQIKSLNYKDALVNHDLEIYFTISRADRMG